MKGITLLELVLVLFIFSLIISIGVYSYNYHAKKISIENDTYTIYSDFTNARTSAFTEKEVKFVKIIGLDKKVIIIDNDSNENNGYISATNLANSFVASSNGSGNIFRFDKNGFADYQGHIRSQVDLSSHYDCVVVSYGRIAIGKYDGNNCVAK
ncbi:MAG: hypothetical protein LDL10_03745 [Calditerrivibrio sp.]|nr:hypothetical protein [Calditerrivibrio sp.]